MSKDVKGSPDDGASPIASDRLAQWAGRLPRPRRFAGKRTLIALLSLVIFLVVVNFAVAWYYSGVLNEEGLVIKEDEPDFDLVASAIGEDLVRLEQGPDDGEWRLRGQWGLAWDGGRGMIGEIVEDGGDYLVRSFTLASGEPPSSAPASVESDIYPNDPYLAFGVPYEDVQYESPLGLQDAWKFSGSDDTWVVFVHGHRENPGEGMSALPALQALGMPALFITYRNDKGQPKDPSNRYQYGLTEWEDLHAAVEYVLSQPGAKNVALIGHSMGGGIVAKFLYESPLADSVVGAVMDSPMLDFAAPVDLGARERNLPGFVSSSVKWMAARRFGVDWEALNYLKDADRFGAPILLIHGEQDRRIPIETSHELARLRSDLVTYSVYPDAGHTDAWYLDSARYENDLREFLLRIGR